VDRIGQRRRVHATMIVARHEAEAGLLMRLAKRGLAARRHLGSEVLKGALPSERVVARAMFQEQEDATGDYEDPSPALVPLCRTFQRRARAAARVVTAKRAAARRWRIPRAGAGGAALVAYASGLAGFERSSALLICTVPILDGRGREIERHLYALSCDRREVPPSGTLQAAIGNKLSARLTRLAPLVAARTARDLTVDGAIDRHLSAVKAESSRQGSMFLPRPDFNDDRGGATVGADGTDDRRTDSDASHLSVGVPHVIGVVRLR
jgi:hypothetical protein